jgi:hypothetical protein
VLGYVFWIQLQHDFTLGKRRKGVRAAFRGFHHPSFAFSTTSWLSPLVEVGAFPRGYFGMAFSREAFSLAGWKTVVST